jgi:hypothetical protein
MCLQHRHVGRAMLPSTAPFDRSMQACSIYCDSLLLMPLFMCGLQQACRAVGFFALCIGASNRALQCAACCARYACVVTTSRIRSTSRDVDSMTW